MNLRKLVLSYLEHNDSLCMDDEVDREVLAYILTRELLRRYAMEERKNKLN